MFDGYGSVIATAGQSALEIDAFLPTRVAQLQRLNMVLFLLADGMRGNREREQSVKTESAYYPREQLQ